MSETKRRPNLAVLTPLAVLASAGMIYQASNAAFTATTSNDANTFSSGTVVLADDDAANVMFNASGLTPGDTATKCINVSYSGTVAANVKLYATGYTNTGLAEYLDFTIEEGTGATGGATFDCTGFTGPTSLHTGTLAAFGTANTAYASGLSSWQPAGATTRSYRMTYTVRDVNAAQGKSAGLNFTWEARNV